MQCGSYPFVPPCSVIQELCAEGKLKLRKKKREQGGDDMEVALVNAKMLSALPGSFAAGCSVSGCLFETYLLGV